MDTSKLLKVIKKHLYIQCADKRATKQKLAAFIFIKKFGIVVSNQDNLFRCVQKPAGSVERV